MQGYWVWGKLVEALADVGYDTNNLVRAPGTLDQSVKLRGHAQWAAAAWRRCSGHAIMACSYTVLRCHVHTHTRSLPRSTGAWPFR